MTLRLSRIGKYLFAVAFTITYLVHVRIAERDSVHERITSDEAAIGGDDDEGHIHIRRTTAGNSRAWTESHSPYHVMDPYVRISFRLHDPDDVPYPDKFLSVVPYMCGSEKAHLPPSLAGRAVLNFTTTIATDLKVIHLGDSLGQQFVQGFDASVLGLGHEDSRAVLQEYFYDGKIYSHNCLSVAAPVRGGGVSAYWRATDLISRENRRREAACAKEELRLKQRVGWSVEQAISLVDHGYFANESDSSSNSNNLQKSTESFPVGPFDAVVMRIPHGWMDIPDITRERIEEAIRLSHDNLGIQTVIITTLPFNNNVLTASDWEGINRINGMVREVAREWKAPPGGRGVRHILVQEFGDFTNRILWESARHLGYAAPDDPARSRRRQRQNGWELSGADFLFDRLPLAKWKWPPSIPMVCAEKPPEGARGCPRNRISSDGIHWCIETLGPRYSASVACLLGCVYNGRSGATPGPGSKSDREVRECEQECNDRFMSVAPVDERWIGREAVIFSQ